MISSICESVLCTGCEACKTICPQHAISMLADAKGFLYPHIDNTRCVDCGLCRQTCPSLMDADEYTYAAMTAYAAWVKDENIRAQSSSGGIFSALAEKVLEEGGVVFGVCWNAQFEAVVSYCTEKEQLDKFRGSKYVQSCVGNAHEIAQGFLQSGRTVLYAGTSCQIAGLKAYLRRKYENLITVDFFCHGVPSPAILAEHLNKLQADHKDRIVDVRFRYKKPSWSVYSLYVAFADSPPYIKSVAEEPYSIAFVNSAILRDACYACRYAGQDKPADITVADFWGYAVEKRKMRDAYNGCSVLMINTEKGKALYCKIEKHLVCEEKTLPEVYRSNIKRPSKKAPETDRFWEAYCDGHTFDELSEEFFPPRRRSVVRETLSRIYRYVLSHAWLFPKAGVERMRNMYDARKRGCD